MTDVKHSLGPWRVSYERGTTQIRTADNESIMGNEAYYPWVPENPADWHLIAAAPEMLEALIHANEMAHGLSFSESNIVSAWAKRVEAKTSAAIAKAQGKE